MSVSPGCSEHGFVTFQLYLLTRLGLGACVSFSLPPAPNPTHLPSFPESQTSVRSTRAVVPSPRKAICWPPPWSSSFPQACIKSAESRLFGDTWKAEGHTSCVFCTSLRAGWGEQHRFYWQKWHQIALWLMVLHSRGLSSGILTYASLLCSCWNSRNSFFISFSRQLICLGVESDRLSSGTIMKSQTTQN